MKPVYVDHAAERRRAVTAILMPLLDAWHVPDSERRAYLEDCSEMAREIGFARMLDWLATLAMDMDVVRK